jgi:hypothetical protein
MRNLFGHHHYRPRRARSWTAKRAFLRIRGYKRVPRGFHVEHRVPLFAGGSDSPSNMQVMTKFAHKAKTRNDYKMYKRR